MNAKYFLRLFMLFLALFIAFHAYVWETITKPIFGVEGYSIGGLGRLSYLEDSILYRHRLVTLAKQHFEYFDWNGGPVDIITIGDSFSNGAGGGRNQYYQDYIATNFDLRVLNIDTRMNPIEMILALLQTRLLDQMAPKMILVESVERSCIAKFAGDFDWGKAREKDEMQEMIRPFKVKYEDFKLPFINANNYRAFIYKHNIAKNENVFVLKLKQKYWSVANADLLLSSPDDIRNIPRATLQTVEKLNTNLNELAGILQERGISFYFMPVVDKYNLYTSQERAVKPKSQFFELLRALEHQYVLIDTKKILLPVINQKKDVYYPDDTHWSEKAMIEIFSMSVWNFKE